MLNQSDIQQAEASRGILRHVLDQEPANKKAAAFEILLWALDTLAPILIKNGKYRKPTILNFGLFRLVGFAIELIKRINAALKERRAAPDKPIQQ